MSAPNSIEHRRLKGGQQTHRRFDASVIHLLERDELRDRTPGEFGLNFTIRVCQIIGRRLGGKIDVEQPQAFERDIDGPA